MIIHSLKLENFGKHKNLEINNINSSIVGIVGPNGFGKSTILKAIAFAFKGKDDDYPINECIKNDAVSGSIELVFEKNNIIGKIVRKFGKKDSALLEWDSNVYTRKLDISNKIDEILGVDKQVLSNTIFIKQGEILDLIKATPGKRKELFSKLLNLDFLNKKYSNISDIYNLNKDSVTDVQALKENLVKKQEEITKFENALYAKKIDFNKLYISDSFIEEFKEKISNYILYSEELKRNNDELQKLDSMEYLNEKIQNMEKQVLEIKNKKDDLSNNNDALKNKVISLENDKINFCTMNNCISLCKELAEAESILKNKYKIYSYDDYIKVLDELNNNLVCIKNKEENLHLFKVSVSSLLEAIDKFNQVSIVLDECEQENNKLNESISLLDKSIENSKQLFSLKKKIKDKLEKNNKCPICGLELAVGQNVSDDDLRRLESNIKEFSDKNKLLKDKKYKISMEMVDHNKNRTELFLKYRSNQSSLLKSVVNLFYKDSYFDIKILNNSKGIKDKIDTLEKEIRNVIDIYYITKRIKKQISSDILKVTSFKNVIYSSIEKYDSMIEEAKRVEEINRIESKKYDALYNEKCNDMFNFKQKRYVVESQIKVVDKWKEKLDNLKLHDYLNKIQSVNSAFNTPISNIYSILIPNALKCLEEIKINESNLKFLKQSYNNELSLLNSKMSQNKKIFDKMYDLDTIRECINIKNENSLPMQYIKYLFEYICESVKENLALMDSDFIVDVDENEELSFKFKRNFDLDKPWLKMDKLSGGQQVRLSLTILIAIQKIICPDLGFLVLDEPSTHLDEDGVEALANMMTNLEEILKTSKSQIWFVDHNPTLKRCCKTTIDLTK